LEKEFCAGHPKECEMRRIHFFLVFSLILTFLRSQAQVAFTDVTKASGIDHHFEVYEGMFGGGVAVLDFDGDGFEDLYITGGVARDMLYRNNGDGTFTDASSTSGISTSRYVTQGVASADVNRDGWRDLFITTITRKDTTRIIPRAENLLFLNNGDGTFRNATKEFRIDRLQSFSTGANFGDINKDGYPDLFIGNYFQNYEGSLTAINDATIVNSSSTSEPYLLINQDGEYFSNSTYEYDVKFKGFGFGGVFTDFDNDNDLDLYVNNDFGYKAKPNVFLKNNYPDEELEDISKSSGMDLKINAMGTAIGDYDNNGFLDYYITNIRFNRFMVNDGKNNFIDKGKESGMDFVSISWGANFADFDNDADLDLFVANGDLNPNDVPMADYYFENAGGKFTEIAPRVGLNDYGVGRGSVVFDMDNDGDLDLLVVNQKPVNAYPVESYTRLYRNETSGGNWIKVQLKGKQSDLQGIGSRVEVVIGKTRLIREIDGGSSHLSQNSTVAHFGIGAATKVDSIVIRWMGGHDQVVLDAPANQTVIVVEEEREKASTAIPIALIVLGIGGGIFFLNRLYIKAAPN
jgi:enediyne biosynthesis protein E4